MNQISAHIDGELPEASVELVRLHLSSCVECAERFGYLEDQEEALARLLVNDPGDEFFADFAERVLGPAQPAPAAAPEASAATPEPTSPASPPRALLASPAPPVAPRATPAAPPAPPAKPEHAPRERTRRRHGTARFLLPAAAMLLVVSGVAIVSVRRGSVHSPTASWIVEHLDPASWLESAASGRNPDPSAADEGLEPAAPTDTGSAPATPTVIDAGALDRAAARSAMAESVRSPEAYDEAASAWTAALPLLESDPEELASGRGEIASARYVAWSLAPTQERRASATEAVRAYLLVAPPGKERDLAWKWLARLKR